MASYMRPYTRCLRLSRKHWASLQRYGSGYVVLLPEIPEDTSASNSILKTDGYPEYDQLSAERIYGGLGRHILEYETGLSQIEESLKDGTVPKTFKTVMEPLEKLSVPLDCAWSIAKVIYTARNDLLPGTSYLPLHERAKQARLQKFCSLPLFYAVKELNADRDKLTGPQKRIVDKFLLEACLNGIELTGAAEEQLKTTLQKLMKERKIFREKCETSLRRFKHTIRDPGLVKEFPADLLKSMADDSTRPQEGPWTVTQKPHIYRRFLEYCPDRTLRWNAWHAHTTLASSHINQDINHSVTLEEIRSLRKDLAQVLGYESFAHMSMETKMAGKLETVQSMITTLAHSTRITHEKQLEELQDFAHKSGFEGKLQLWDLPYWRRKHKLSLVNMDEARAREYFPFPHVLDSLLEICQDWFGVRFERSEPRPPTFHPDVLFYRVCDEESGEELAAVYIDPYMRPGEKLYTQPNAAWMMGGRSRSEVVKTKPIANLIFNFLPPLGSQPALLSIADLQTLLEKMGSAMQHLLTLAPYSEISGSNNIEWDASQAVPLFFRQWLLEPVILEKLSQHYASKKRLSQQMANILCQSQIHLASHDLLNELYISDFDLTVHNKKEFWLDIMKELWASYFPAFTLERGDNHPFTLTTIFSEEWGAAYYSHTWARMIAADSFNAFEEVGFDKPDELKKVGRRYRETFLSLGGGCHPAEVFRRFRGRDPSPDALLHSLSIHRQKSHHAKSLKQSVA